MLDLSKTSVSLWTAISLMVFAAGCDLFQTRDPEPPIGNQQTGDIAATPEEAIQFLTESISVRDPDLYLLMIDESFSYAAGPNAYPENPGAFEGWNSASEETFIRRLLTTGLLPLDSLSQIQFSSITVTERGDSARYLESYHLEIHSIRDDLPRDFQGLADLTIVRGSDGGWRIVHWLDEVSGDSPTMSRLRATL